MRKYFLILSFVSIVSCQSNVVRTGEGLIASSVFPVCDILRQIVGEDMHVMHAVPVGANPHTYEPLPSDVRALQRVRLFIGIHPEFDGWMEEYLTGNCRRFYILEPGGKPPSPSRGHHDDDRNPHVWLSVRNMIAQVDALAGLLSETKPGRKEEIFSNGTVYKERLRSVDEEITEMFKDSGSRPFIQWHPAWDEFARDYNLEIVGTVEHGHGDTPSVKEFRWLVEKARRAGVGVIVVGLNVQSSAVESLSREIGAAILRLDTVGDPEDEEKNSYTGLMLANARLLAGALR